LRDIGDARISLEEVLSGAPDLAPVGRAEAATPLWRRALPWALFGVMSAVALAALTFVYFRRPVVLAGPVQRFEIAAPDADVDAVALSPDGTRLLLVSSGQNLASRMWLRRMDSLETHPIAGTEGSVGLPFWSPDSRFIAFGTVGGKLKRIDTEGGPAQALCDSGSYVVGGFWTPHGKIVFSDPSRPPGLWEVPAAGGVSSPLPGIEGNAHIAGPVLLPDGRHFLYASGTATSGEVYLGSLDSKPGQHSKRLLSATGAEYAPSPVDPSLGYLLFGRAMSPGATTATLMAQPFDLRKQEVVGEPAPVAEQVSSASVSLTGSLVYSVGGPTGTAGQLTLFDRQGKVLATVGEPGSYEHVAFSPDGKRVVAARKLQSGSENLWMVDLFRGISTRFTFGTGIDFFPVWSPDGNRIVFASVRNGALSGLYRKLSNGGGEEELLLQPDYGAVPVSWSGDGRLLIFGGGSTILDERIWVLPLDANGHAAGKPFPFVQKGVGIEERFSPGPQGHPLWVAYSSDESGRLEVYVRPFDPNSPTGTPAGGGKWQISTHGGTSPRWNGNGKELLYVAPDGTVMSAEVRGTGVFQSGIPKPLFKPKGPILQTSYAAYWDVTSDGEKFIFPVALSTSEAAPPRRFTVVLNWPSLLKK